MGYLDRIAVPPSAHGRFPWEIAAAERPELVTLVRVLIAHGLLATAVAGELRERGWLDTDELLPPVAAAIHRRYVNRRRAVGPYAPLVAVPVGPCDSASAEGAARLAGHLERERGAGAAPDATGEAACAACGRQGTPTAPLTLHHDVPVSRGDTPPAVAELAALCPACHRCAHSRTPPLLVVELRSLRERAAAGKR